MRRQAEDASNATCTLRGMTACSGSTSSSPVLATHCKTRASEMSDGDQTGMGRRAAPSLQQAALVIDEEVQELVLQEVVPKLRTHLVPLTPSPPLQPPQGLEHVLQEKVVVDTGGNRGALSAKSSSSSREWYPGISSSSSRNTEGGHSYRLAGWMKASCTRIQAVSPPGSTMDLCSDPSSPASVQ
eukprot:350948-Amphidinium_carterae.1